MMRRLLAALVLAAALAAGPAAAQETTLVSNIAHSIHSNEIVSSDDSLAQRFTTGANPGGYTLSSVAASIGSASSTAAEVKVSIWSESGGTPHMLVHSLMTPSDFGENKHNTFTALPDATLTASTNYFVVFTDADDTAGRFFRIAYTRTLTQTGLTEWDILDVSHSKFRDNAWISSSARVLKIEVTGSAAANAAPSFPALAATELEVAENTPADTAIGEPYTATDANMDDTLIYSLEGTDATSFEIDSTGQLTTKTALDYETKSSYKVTVTVSDGTASATIDVTITVTDEDEPPKAPAAPAVTATSSTSLDVSWQAPDNTGRPDIESYDLRYRKSGATVWINGPQDVAVKGATIDTGLEAGTDYEVQVRATSDEGDSVWSASGAGTTGATVSGDPTVTIAAAAAVSEADDDVVFTLTRTGATTAKLTVQVQVTEEGDVLANAAAYATPVDVEFGIGDDTAKLVVALDDDSAYDPDLVDPTKRVGGRVTAAVQAGTSYVPGAVSSVTVDVTDDEDAPLTATLTLEPASPVAESVGTVTVVLTVETAAGGRQPRKTYASTISSRSETASSAEGDYEVLTAQVLVPPSEFALDGTVWRATERFTIQIHNDDVDEDNETFRVITERPPPSDRSNLPATDTLTVTITDDDVVPGAPTNLAATAGDAKVTLRWGAPSDAGTSTVTGYQYRQSSDGGSTWGSWTDAGDVLEKEIAGLTNGTEYTFEVRAVSAAGAGPPSAERTGTPTAPNVAPIFMSLAIASVAENATSTALTVQATDADDAVTGYTLAGGADQSAFEIDGASGALTFITAPDFEHPTDVDSTTPPNGAGDNVYVVVVRATSGTGARVRYTDQTVTITVTDKNEPPGAPDGATVTVTAGSSTSLDVSWEAPDNTGRPDIESYDLRYKLDDDLPGWTLGPQDVAGTSTTISGLSADTAYWVQVRASNADGDGLWSSSTRRGRTSAAANAAPTFTSSATASVAEHATTTVLTVVATDSDTGDSVTGYALTGGADQLQFAINATSGVLTFDTEPDYETPTDAELDNSYVVIVQATSGTGDRVLTAEQTITVTVTDVAEAPAAPAAPTFGTATASSLEVNWAAPANAGPAITDYDVRWRVKGSGATWTEADDTTDSTDLTATITGLAASTEYEVQVRAQNDEGTGAWSASGDRTTDAAANAAAAVSISATPTSVSETDAAAVFTLTRPGATTAALTVQVQVTQEGDVLANAADYASPVSVTFGIGSAEETLTVAIDDDLAYDPDLPGAPIGVGGRVTATLQDGTGYTLGSPSTHTVDVIDDENSPLTATFTIDPSPVLESVGTVTVTVTLATAPGGRQPTKAYDYDFTIGSSSSTAEAGVDYSIAADFALPGIISATDYGLEDSVWRASVRRTITILDDDVDEAEKTITVYFENLSVGSQGTHVSPDDPVTVTIIDDDEVPGAPTNLAATPGDAKVTLGWGAPSDAGTSSVTGYDYRVSSDGGSTWGSWTDAGDVRETEVTGLTNGTEYTFEVRAVSAAGDGAAERITGTPAANAAATGTVTISDPTPAYGEALTAVTSAADGDGLTSPTYSYAWLRGAPGGTPVVITGADSPTYTPVAADIGQTLQARVSFTDDKSNPETLTSRATAVVTQRVTVSLAVAPTRIFEDAASKAVVATLTMTTEAAAAPTAALSISLYTVDVIASAAVDYTAAAEGRITYTPGDFSLTGDGASYAAPPFTYTVATVRSDSLEEHQPSVETFEVGARATAGTTLPSWVDLPGVATVTIVDEDTRGLVLTPATLRVVEEDPAGETYTVALRNEPFGTVTVAVSGQGTDLTVTPDNLTFTTSNWRSAQEVTVTAGNDANAADESVTLTHTTSGTHYAGLTGTVAVTVADNDRAGVSVTGPAEVDESDREAEFTLTRPGATTAALTVQVQVTQEGDVLANAADYANPVSVTFGIGSAEETLTVAIDNDGAYDPDLAGPADRVGGRVTAVLQAGTGYTLGSPSTHTVDVIDDEDAPLTATFTIDPSPVPESVGTVTVTVTLATAPGGRQPTKAYDYDFTIGSSSGTAVAGQDYRIAGDFEADGYIPATDYALEDSVWRTTVSRSITILDDDVDEADETITVYFGNLSVGSQANHANPDPVTVTITDDDEVPGAPTNLAATAGDAKVTLSWGAPSDAGTSTVTGYEYRQSRDGGSTWGSWTDAGDVREKEVTGLTNGTEYTFEVRAVSAAGDGAAERIAETPAANAAPTFTSSATASVAEHATTTVLTVVATDSDTGDDITGYALTGGADQLQFAINATSGVLTFDTEPDYENPAGPDNTYVVIVQATSGAGDRALTATQTITVTVTDVAEAPAAPPAPTFPSATASGLTVSWAAPTNAGPAISDYDVRWRVKDSGATWTEAADTTDSTDLSATITGLTASETYEVQVRAQNAEGTGEWSPSGDGTTNAAANAAPTFTSSATASVAEHATTTVLTVVATDSDTGDDITGYALTGGADQLQFAINATSGVLTFDTEPDYENPAGPDNTYVVIVQATSGAGDRALTATQTITVTVTDVAEAPAAPPAPTFPSATASGLTVSWAAPANAGPAISDYDVRWRVKDSGATWTEAADTTDSTDLSATITGLTASETYEVQVRAQNAEGTGEWSPSGDGTTNAAANAAPTFTSSATASVAEHATTTVLTVVATDSDTGDDITGYALTGGADQLQFAINATSGVLTFDTEPDYENPAGPDNTYVVIVQATSGAGDRALTATQTITVTVTDVAEAPAAPPAPTFPSATASGLTVSWAAPANAGPAISDYDVRWRVKDSGATWTEAADTTDSTDLSATITGLTASETYEVQVRAQNAEGTGEWSPSGDGTTNAAANAAPTFTSSATASVVEHATTTVLTVVATDSDTGDDITGYALTGGADQLQFAINATSGVLTFDTEPDYENPAGPDNTYVVIVQATSGAGDRALTATQTITVTVTDVAEAPAAPPAPTFPSATASGLTVSWAAPANAGPAISDYDVRWRVKDSGATWTEAADTTDSTDLSATITGLTASETYEVQVRAQNAEGTGEWSPSGDGTTNAAANAAPTFTSSATASVAEHATTTVLTVVATDSDTGDDITGYALTGGADQLQFAINATSGVLTFDTEPDYENPAGPDNTYVVIVQATSGAGDRALTATQTITVTVTDVAEAPAAPPAPTFPSATASGLTVSWAAPTNAGPAISDYDVRWRVKDSGATWTEAADTTDSTDLSATITGLTASETYEVQVRAQNAEGTGEWSPSGDGTTNAAANAAPTFTSSATASVAEHATTTVLTVVATDSDTGDDITGYALTGGADQLQFAINATSGVLTFDTEPDYENPAGPDNTYVVIVQATSGAGDRALTATQTITVTVTDVAEAPAAPPAPTFPSATASGLTVSWAAPANAGPAISDYDVRWRVKDSGATWTEAADTTDSTDLSATITGLTASETYEVQVRAQNAEGTGEWSPSGDGTTNAAANAAPTFTSSATASVVEHATTTVLTVVATDSDTGDDITGYALTGGADQLQFAINATSGVLTFDTEPDYENPAGPDNTYVVIVQATSGAGDRALTATQTITVTVTDVAEAPAAPPAPTFPSATASGLTVSWAAPANAGPAISDYDVRWRVKDSGATWTEAADTTDSTDLSATITGLTASETYEVQVRAQNAEGTGEWSPSGDGTTNAAANAAPTFTSSATASVVEHATTTVLTVVATDSDTGDDITGYALTGGADQLQFAINATSGVLTFDTEPDYENPAGPDNTYVVIVQATSGAGDRALTATQTITVTVTDVAEAPAAPPAPTFPSATASGLTVSWAAPANAGPAISDYDVRWRVKDSGATWTEAADTTDSTDLSATITGLTASETYEVQVRAQNAEGTGEWSPSGDGTTNAAANAAPTFTSSATASVVEHATTTVLTVVATDSDTGDDITGYALTGGADQLQFAINATSGVLTFDTEPDYENPAGPDNTYVVIVQATSGAGDRALTATQTITVTVTDVAEAPAAPPAPTFPSATASGLTVSWAAPANAGPAISDYDVRWRVKDSGATWTEAADTTDSTDLSATITGLTASETYEVQVRAQNAEGTGEWSPSGDGTTNAAANAAPTFTSSATASVVEHATTTVLTVVATDSDTGDDITGYALTGGADQLQFAINATSGVLTFDTEPDYENPAGPDNTYVVIVQATSGAGDRALTATQTITVTVTDVAEAPAAPPAPTFPSATASGLTVSWAAPANAGPAISDYDVRWRVKDSGATWTEAADTTDSTDLSATITGLTASETYEVQVRAQNAEGTGEWSPSGDGTTNAAANAAPTFTSSATASVAEHATTTVLTVVATDSDTGDDITGYALTGGADQLQFAINATSGVLTFDTEPDYENPAGPDNTYVVIVQATSGAGDRALTATQTITVTVTDVAEAPAAPPAPTFPSATASGLTVSWAAPANAGPAISDYDVRWRVKDSGATWTEAADTTDSTDLSATITGLTASETYEVQVRAQNAEGTGEWSPSGDGTTNAAANAAPTFTSSATASVAEHATTTVLTVVATDSDTGDDITGYALTGGADQLQFAINATSGVLTFDTEPDYENPAGPDNTYVVIVQATSGAGDRALTATQTITVTVTDVAEAPAAPPAPTFPSATASGLTVSWAAPANAGPAISDYDVRWRVKDSGATWTEAADTTDSTDLSATITGLAASTEYEVQVRAQNAEGTGEWSPSGDGTTNAAANAAPTFTSSATASVAEHATTTVLTVVATDSDAEDDITGYALTGGADQLQFAINATSGVLTFDTEPDYENPTSAGLDNSYVVIVQATSGAGDRVLTATQTITVTVTDVAEAPGAPGAPGAPTFPSATASGLTVSWSAPANAGPAISDYDVRWRVKTPPGSWTELEDTTDSTDLSATITGLTASETYEVQVRAENAEGTGAWSPSGDGTTNAATAAAPARFRRLNGEILALHALALSDQTSRTLTQRLATLRLGQPETAQYQLGGAGSLAQTLHATLTAGQGQGAPRVDLKELLGTSSFVLPLRLTATGLGVDRLTLWGQGAYTNLARDADATLDWAGDTVSAQVGADVRLQPDLLAGVTVTWADSGVDYRTGPGRAVGGTHEHWLVSLQPYLGWQSATGVGLWATVGYGWGEVTLTDDQVGTQESDLTLQTAAVGARGPLLRQTGVLGPGATTVTLKSDATVTRVDVAGNGAAVAEQVVDAGRLRLLLEGQHVHETPTGARVAPFVELGVRYDLGDGLTGVGAELGGGLRYTVPRLGLTVEGRGRGLVGHRGYTEWGATGLVRVDPGVAGHGLAVTLAPTYGPAASRVQQLWAQAPGQAIAPTGGRAALQAGVDAELGYGLAHVAGATVLTPYGAAALGRGAAQYRLGGRWSGATGLRLSLEGVRQEAAGQQPATQGIRLQATWNF